ncbi:MAG TPA: outer membrane beta-barrel protein [Pyrinomonadaceae bacterium]|jgi:hypothetical protein
MRRLIQILTLGATCLFFAPGEAVQAQSDETPRYEVGAQFSSLSLRDPSFSNFTEPGFGGRFTVNITDYLAAEAQVDFYPQNRSNVTESSGGRTLTGLFGLKAGKRYERFGLYAKARPGFIHFSRTIGGFSEVPVVANPPFTLFIPQYRSRTEFAADIGGVLELYPTRRIVTRFDFGDTIIRYQSRTIGVQTIGTPPTATVLPLTRPPETGHNFQFSAGIGFRF